MTHVVVDPVTRIEGHLRIEAEVDGGSVREAWSSSTMFRGVELILKGRDPRDAWAFTQRICGVCTTVHAIASIRAVENAIGATPPPNARLLRNLIIASQCVQDHVIHFYHLHALDWVDIVSALKADPAKTAALAQSISDWPLSSPTYFAAVQNRVKGFVERGQLGPFANAYWGHSAYKLPAEANLMAVAHYLEALEWQREVIKIHAVLGGKNPHLQGFLVGGMATPVDPDKQASINMGSIARHARPDGEGPRLRGPRLHPRPARGRLVLQGLGGLRGRGGQLPRLRGVPPGRHEAAPALPPLGRHPRQGPLQGRGLRPREDHRARQALLVRLRGGRRQGPAPVERRDEAPLHGPGAALREARHGRQVQLAQGAALRRSAHGGGAALPDARRLRLGPPAGQGARRGRCSGSSDVGPAALFSTLGRVAARGIETLVLAERMEGWLDELAANIGHDLRIHDNDKWSPSSWPKECSGAGFHEAPRGALGHWVHIKDGAIAELPVRRAQHLERGTAGRGRQPRAVRGGAPRDAGRRTPSSPSRSCAPSTRSTPAWRAASTWSTRRGARSRG